MKEGIIILGRKRKIQQNRVRWGLRSRIFGYFVLLVIVPFAIFNIFYYQVYENYAKERYGLYNLELLKNVQRQIDQASQEIVNGTMVYYYSGMVDLIAQSDITQADIRDIKAELGSMKNSFNNISSIYLVNDQLNIRVGNNYKDFLAKVEPYNSEVIHAGGRRVWLPTQYLLPKKGSGYQLILGKSLNTKLKKNVAILYIVLDTNKIVKAFDNLNHQAGVKYLIDDQHRVIYSTQTDEIGQPLASALIPHSDSKNGYYIGQFEQVKSLIVYHQSYQNNWASIIVVPLKTVLSEYNPIKLSHLIMSLIYVLFIIILFLQIERQVLNPIRILTKATDSVARGRFNRPIELSHMGELELLNQHFDQMTQQIEQLIKKNEKEIREKNDFKIKILLSQLNPHFIFNTLNTIKWMAVINKQDNIQELTQALIHMLMMLARVEDDHYYLDSEMKLVQQYAIIQKARFMNFDISFEIEASAQYCKIRKFLVQPVVENAILHGFSKGTKRKGKIEVKAYCDQQLHIVVLDNGNGFDVDKWRQTGSAGGKEHASIALNHIEQIIKLDYGEQYQLVIQSQLGEGTKVEYILPILREEEQ